MALLTELGTGQGYLKAGFLGFQKSGKTFTSVLLAIAVRQKFGLTGPIVFIDTENASEYVAPLVKQLTGQKLIGIRTRAFNELLEAAKEAESIGASVLVADSMTHFWRSMCDAYLVGVNESRAKWGKSPKKKMDFQDWGPVKAEWGKWTDFFLNSKLHIIICGRAGYEYDMEKGEDGKNELIKTGVKMKTEAEFGFEPSLLVQMDAEQVPNPKKPGDFMIVRRALVIGDRFGKIDGKQFTFAGVDNNRQAELKAVAEAFNPFLEMLRPGAHSEVKTDPGQMPVDENGDADWQREKQMRTVLCEEIQGCIVAYIPGQSADEKRRKAELLMEIFGTRSWTAVESMKSEQLRAGLAKLRKQLGEVPPAPQDDVPFDNFEEPKQGTTGSHNSDTHSQKANACNPKPATAQEAASAPVSAITQENIPPVTTNAPPVSSPQTAEAPRTVSEPTPTPTQPELTGEPTVSKSHELLFNAIPEQYIAQAVSWMVKYGWITADQTDNPFAHVDEAKAVKVANNPQAFIRAITGGKR